MLFCLFKKYFITLIIKKIYIKTGTYRNYSMSFVGDYLNKESVTMNNNQTVEKQLEALNEKLSLINHNMLKVFWIVAIFALLYFGLMIYMLFFR